MVSEFSKGDKVVISICPQYRSACGSHKARIIGEPILAKGGWLAPIRFNCLGISYANYPCNNMLKTSKGINMKLSKPAIITGIVLIVLIFLGVWATANHNDLVRSRNQVDNKHSRIDTSVQRRYELVDNLVASVEGSQLQEQKVFGDIANARKLGSSSNSASDQAAANAQIDTQIALLPRLQEAYPELRSNEQMSKLIQELKDISVEVRDARNDYNDTVTNYNNNISSAPKNIFAWLFHYKTASLYKADAAAQANPKVDFKK